MFAIWAPISSPAPVALKAPEIARAPTINSSMLNGIAALASFGFNTPHNTIANAPITVTCHKARPNLDANIIPTASAKKIKIPAASWKLFKLAAFPFFLPEIAISAVGSSGANLTAVKIQYKEAMIRSGRRAIIGSKNPMVKSVYP